MGRLSTRLAGGALDAEIRVLLDEASRAVRRAIQACGRAEPFQQRRADATRRQLAQVLGLLESAPLVASRLDSQDRDLMPAGDSAPRRKPTASDLRTQARVAARDKNKAGRKAFPEGQGHPAAPAKVIDDDPDE